MTTVFTRLLSLLASQLNNIKYVSSDKGAHKLMTIQVKSKGFKLTWFIHNGQRIAVRQRKNN